MPSPAHFPVLVFRFGGISKSASEALLVLLVWSMSSSGMGHKSLKIDGIKEETTSQLSVEIREPKGDHLATRCKNKLDYESNLVQNVQRSGVGSCALEFLVPNIPKHITTSDEKYLLRCLEVIHTYAIRNSGWNSSRTRIFPVDSNCLTESISIDDHSIASLAVANDWSIVSITDSQSMQNILRSPLLQQFGSTDSNPSAERRRSLDEPINGISRGPMLRYSYLLSQETRNKAIVVDYKSFSVSSHKRAGSVSSMTSSLSEKSSSASSFEGTLRCTWKDGLPHHVFSVEDKREVYRAQASKVESLDDKALDYVYTFYVGKHGKDRDTSEMETVATMRVSTSITVCSSMKEITETKFILYAPSENHAEGLNVDQTYKKSERLSRKLVNVFRPDRSSTQRAPLRTCGPSTIVEDTLWGCEEKTHLPSNEVAAIILKEIRQNPVNADVGGWGLKFLKKAGNDSSASEKQEFCENTRNSGQCSTSMNVLIPAGLHGGTKHRVGGPSSLVERWISGGACDCGGWDIGCPLTVLVPGHGPTEIPSPECSSGKCRPPVDLFIQGSRGESPILSMLNVSDGVYNIRFESMLSSLQCFGIAAAVCHSQNPQLRLKKERS